MLFVSELNLDASSELELERLRIQKNLTKLKKLLVELESKMTWIDIISKTLDNDTHLSRQDKHKYRNELTKRYFRYYLEFVDVKSKISELEQERRAKCYV